MAETPIFDQLAEALAGIVTRFGNAAFTDRRRTVSLLADMLPDAKREIRAAGSAIDEGVPSALAGAERQVIGMEMDRQAARLEAETGLDLRLARQTVRAFAHALGLGPLPSVYEDVSAPRTAPPPAPPPVADDWAGLSQPVPPSRAAAFDPPPPPAPAAGDTITIAGRSIPKTRLMQILAVIVAIFVGARFLIGGDATPVAQQQGQQQEQVQGQPQGQTQGQPQGQPTDPAAGPTPPPAADGPQPPVQADAPQADPAAAPPPPAQQAPPERDYAGELSDQGVRAQSTLETNVGSPTPMSIPGGTRLTTAGVQRLAGNGNALLVDVLANPHSGTIRGAVFIPVGGAPGSFDDGYQQQFAQALRNVGAQPDRPLIFFCAGAACWESYNAALRARRAGYRAIYWYRGGLASWSEAGLPMGPLPAPR